MLLPACSFVGATAEIGYTQLALTGEVALASATGGVPAGSLQDMGSALGIGSDQGTPYVRGQLDLGNTVLTASVFVLHEEGSGTLARTFGPLAAATAVRSELDLTNAKLTMTYDIGLGPLKVSPGLGLDVLDLSLSATEPVFGNRGEIDELLPLPMLFCRVEGDIGLVALIAEVGFLDMPEIDGAEVTLLDLEAMVEYRLLPTMQLFAGYRLLDVDGKGETSDSSYALDVTLDGWVIGGGVRF